MLTEPLVNRDIPPLSDNEATQQRSDDTTKSEEEGGDVLKEYATEKLRELQDKLTAYGTDVMTWTAVSRYKALFTRPADGRRRVIAMDGIQFDKSY